MSVFSNPAGSAAEGAARYTAAVLELLSDQDPMAVLKRTPSWCREQTACLTEAQLTVPEAEGKWSLAAVLQHLADSELVWGYRLRKVLAEDRPQIIGMDQDLWARRLGYSRATREEALGLFAALRSSNLAQLGRAAPEDLDRVGVHNERGEESVRRMVRMYAGHDLMHRRQILRIIAILPPASGSMNQVVDALHEPTDPFPAAAARRTLERTEW